MPTSPATMFEDMLLSSTRTDLSHEPMPSFALEQVLELQSVYHPAVMPTMRSRTEGLSKLENLWRNG